MHFLSKYSRKHTHTHRDAHKLHPSSTDTPDATVRSFVHYHFVVVLICIFLRLHYLLWFSLLVSIRFWFCWNFAVVFVEILHFAPHLRFYYTLAATLRGPPESLLSCFSGMQRKSKCKNQQQQQQSASSALSYRFCAGHRRN